MFLGFACCLASASPALCDEYFPLSLDFQWEYEGLDGHDEVQRVEEIVEIWGSDVFAVVYEANPQNEGLVNYWTCDEDGSVYLWGFYLLQHSSGVVYDPPIPMVAAPLELGKTWSCTTDVFDVPDTIYSFSLVLNFTVEEDGIGRVQYVGGYQEVFQLSRFQGPTSCRHGTWSSIKALYAPSIHSCDPSLR